MLQITITFDEQYDSKENRFFTPKAQTLTLEHSLVSISKWESKWEKPFLSSEKKTKEEIIDYIRCMTITQNVDPKIYYYIPSSELKKINDYISRPMTGTKFSNYGEQQKKKSNKAISSEEIYFAMFSYGIPIECEKWHISRLFVLLKIFEIRTSPKKKMSKSDIYSRNAQLNAARRNALNSKG